MIELPPRLMNNRVGTDPFKRNAKCKNCGGPIKSTDGKTWVHGNYESMCPRTWAEPRD